MPPPKSLQMINLIALLALGICMYVLYQKSMQPTVDIVSNSLDTSETNSYLAARVNLDSSDVSRKSPANKQRHSVGVQQFKPMTIRQQRNASFDYRAAMKQLNDAQVPQDDPRLVELIKNYYLVPPSTEPYNLEYPDRLDHSRGQTPFVDSRLDYMEGGFYVEAGALTGEKGSNSLFFESVRKWNGLLVEADPSNFEALMKKHRKAYTINACLNTKHYPSTVIFNKSYNMGRIVQGPEVEKWMKAQGIKKNEVQVQCFPLYSILLALNQLTVDFFSLDVEGDELGVLKTIPMDKVNIKMLAVEFVHETDGTQGLKSYMEGKGYDNMLQMSRWDGGVNDVIFRKKSVAKFY